MVGEGQRLVFEVGQRSAWNGEWPGCLDFMFDLAFHEAFVARVADRSGEDSAELTNARYGDALYFESAGAANGGAGFAVGVAGHRGPDYRRLVEHILSGLSLFLETDSTSCVLSDEAVCVTG